MAKSTLSISPNGLLIGWYCVQSVYHLIFIVKFSFVLNINGKKQLTDDISRGGSCGFMFIYVDRSVCRLTLHRKAHYRLYHIDNFTAFQIKIYYYSLSRTRCYYLIIESINWMNAICLQIKFHVFLEVFQKNKQTWLQGPFSNRRNSPIKYNVRKSLIRTSSFVEFVHHHHRKTACSKIFVMFVCCVFFFLFAFFRFLFDRFVLNFHLERNSHTHSIECIDAWANPFFLLE